MATVHCANPDCDEHRRPCECPEALVAAVEAGEAVCGTCHQPVELAAP